MKTLTFVIPVFNEAERLNKLLVALVKKQKLFGVKIEEIIFVNDGSTDNTLAVLKQAKSKIEKKSAARVRIISSNINRGKGYAVKKGMRASSSDYTLMMDADLSTPISEIKKFLPQIKSNQPVIIGTRKIKQANIAILQPLYRQLLGKIFTFLSQFILNTWVSDFTCGFKFFNSQAKRQIFSNAVIDRWGYDAEILYLAKIYEYPINEIPVKWQDDKRSRVSIIRDSIQSLWELLQIRYNGFSGVYQHQSFWKWLPEIRKAIS